MGSLQLMEKETVTDKGTVMEKEILKVRETVMEAFPAFSKKLDTLDQLLERNKLFAEGTLLDAKMAAVESGVEARKALEEGQWPVAVVVCCSDSRVPPEVIFQVGLGKLFVVRTAGNRADADAILGSVQYAVCHLKTPLVMVLGHSSCGAMKAAIGAAKGEFPEEGALKRYLESAAPLAKSVVERSGEDVSALVRENISNVVGGLRADPSMADKARVVGCVYDLKTGLVEVTDAVAKRGHES
eukprot:CAMPEP_0113955068 /NCGR_PEP_ID=MMETSP0011_2-20120614/1047_1 /TAXON_ID=101924 /ORGANISM="Rhodosorus marinus" /LENGTH=241 /DNA_ID=CAMNT_0000964555 /DNA_START=130 /DNA_END=855 /DNA_ORIENTATION=- /assembly_acc=CAM_ASM_000156